MDTARTLTRTSPSPGVGLATSRSSRTSAVPYRVNTMAFMASSTVPIPARGRPLSLRILRTIRLSRPQASLPSGAFTCTWVLSVPSMSLSAVEFATGLPSNSPGRREHPASETGPRLPFLAFLSGEGGIRTPGTAARPNGFRDRRIQPLCHLSEWRIAPGPSPGSRGAHPRL